MKLKNVHINGQSYTIYGIRGIVRGKDKHLETRVSGGGGGGYSYQGTGTSATMSISSTTIVHDTIFLEDSEGQEHALELQNWDIACREGHEMMALWVIKDGDERGPYVAVCNQTTNGRYIKKEKIAGFFTLVITGPRLLKLFVKSLLYFSAGYAVYAFFLLVAPYSASLSLPWIAAGMLVFIIYRVRRKVVRIKAATAQLYKEVEILIN